MDWQSKTFILGFISLSLSLYIYIICELSCHWESRGEKKQSCSHTHRKMCIHFKRNLRKLGLEYITKRFYPFIATRNNLSSLFARKLSMGILFFLIKTSFSILFCVKQGCFNMLILTRKWCHSKNWKVWVWDFRPRGVKKLYEFLNV